MLSDNDLWLLSFYRHSEITGALFFGRLARMFKPGPIQHNMTHHFADEAQHARYWSSCLHELDSKPVKVEQAYQDLYLDAVGVPTNMMEVLSITRVFEARVIGQYSQHRMVRNLHPVIGQTFTRIMEDEKWHLQWTGEALKGMEPEYGADVVRETLERYQAADREVYEKMVKEHAERLADILNAPAPGGDL